MKTKCDGLSCCYLGNIMAILALLPTVLLPVSLASDMVLDEVIDNTDVIVMDAFAGSPLTTDYGDSTYTDIVWPKMNVSMPDNLTSFTLCYSHYTWRLEYADVRLVNNTNDDKWLVLQVWYLDAPARTRTNNFTREIWYRVFDDWVLIGALDFQMPSWDYLCHSIDLLNGVVDVHVNGVALVKGHSIEGLKLNATMRREFLSSALLNMTKMDKVTMVDIFSGNATNFDCMTSPRGDILSWSANSFTVDNMTKRETVLKSDVCPRGDSYLIYVMQKAEFHVAVDNCQRMGRGLMRSWDNMTALQKLSATFKGTSFWIPYTRLPGNGAMFANFYTGQPVNDIPWKKGYPMDHQCVYCLGGTCATEECNMFFAYMCVYETPPIIVLQGNCPESGLDLLYHPIDKNRTIHWMGLHRTFIKFNENTNRWEARVLASNVWAESTASKKSLLLGTSLWTVHNDFNCFSGTVKNVRLNLNACNRDEFNCDDGFCVPLVTRCDGKSDCPDGSDELSCKVLRTVENYNKEIPSAHRGGHTGEKDSVNFTINILNVLGILETEAKIKIKLRISMEWMDSRLEFFNLLHINLLNEEEFDSIWKPSIRYINKELNLMTHEVNREPAVYVLRNSSYEPHVTAYNELHQERIFLGAYNMLRWTTDISSNFLCGFNFDHYPFDVQVCVVILSLEERQLLTLRPVPENLTFDGIRDIDQQTIFKVQMCNLLVGEEEHVYMELTIYRKLKGFFLTICLPTILVNLVGHLTNYFQSDEFDIAIGVNLTSMLVITTMFVSIMDSLPKTQNIKMVEIWMMVSLFLPTMDVFLQTYLHEILYGTNPVKDILGKKENKMAHSQRFNTKLTRIQKILPVHNMSLGWKEDSRVELSKTQKYVIVRKTLTVVKPVIAVIFYVGFWIFGTFLLDQDQNKVEGSENYYNCIFF